MALSTETSSELRQAVAAALKETQSGQVDPQALKVAMRRVASVAGIEKAKAERLAQSELEATDRFNSRDVTRSVGITVPEFSSEVGERWRKEHVALIRSLREEPKARMVELLREASQKGTRIETLQKQVEEEFGVSDRRARLIAQDQILTLNAKLTEDRHKTAGITRYKWRSLDRSARSHHAELNGKEFDYDDPPMGGGTGPGDVGNPGTGIRCRCQAVPVIPDEVKASKDLAEGTPLKLGRKKAAQAVAVPVLARATANQTTKRQKPKAQPQRPTDLSQRIEALNAAERAVDQATRSRSVDEWVDQLKPSQVAAFDAWSQLDFEYIRAVQRGQTVTASGYPVTLELKRRAQVSIKEIDSALEKAPKYKGKIFRGMSLESEDQLRSIFNQGGEFKSEAITSYSKVRHAAEDFARDGNVRVIIEAEVKHSRVHDIEPVSSIGEEKELLLQKGEIFSVQSVKRDEDGVWRVILSE